MKTFKICPNCGAKNEPNLMDCIECGEDISTVAPATKEALAREAKTEEISMLRICDNCGAENPSNARKCSKCGEDISTITPTEKTANKAKFILTTIDGSYSFEISDNECILGRENAMSEYLEKKSYVGRRHCKLTIEDGKLYIEDLKSTNHTFAKNKSINEKTELKAGDDFSLGGNVRNGKRDEQAAYFIVK